MVELGITTALAVDAPTDAEQRQLWRLALAVDEQVPSDAAVSALAGEFRLSASQIAGLSQRALVLGDGDTPAQARADAAADHAWASCVRHTAAALAGVTRWVEPRATLADIELPASERAQIERLIAHARHRRIVSVDFGFEERGGRGLGLTALFHGESGTGKTFAAEAVAHALSLGLAVVDFSKVSSKWVGEAEKNWCRVFDAAECGGAVLFIDEADAKFNKRRDGSTSQDHYINAEIDYLLTRMESYGGIAILATNMKHVLDPAFMRRLRFVVGFPFPGVAQRKAIWQTVFPAAAPLGELDCDRLARFSLTGGSIFNAALGAAHAAAAEGSRVEMPHVLEAVRWELRKLERPVGEATFRHPPMALAGSAESLA
jgi:SpoVK/Ycf46/Vps4 family AAA+-type ATPase